MSPVRDIAIDYVSKWARWHLGPHAKAVATSISAPVTKLFNLSISTGIFPNKRKVSSVVPIPKSADKHNPGNYGPISLLPVLSKLLERHIFSLLSKHLDQSHSISDSQWGFQAGKSIYYYCPARNYK